MKRYTLRTGILEAAMILAALVFPHPRYIVANLSQSEE